MHIFLEHITIIQEDDIFLQKNIWYYTLIYWIKKTMIIHLMLIIKKIKTMYILHICLIITTMYTTYSQVLTLYFSMLKHYKISFNFLLHRLQIIFWKHECIIWINYIIISLLLHIEIFIYDLLTKCPNINFMNNFLINKHPDFIHLLIIIALHITQTEYHSQLSDIIILVFVIMTSILNTLK